MPTLFPGFGPAHSAQPDSRRRGASCCTRHAICNGALIYSRAYRRRQNHHDEAGATDITLLTDEISYVRPGGGVFGVRHSLRGELARAGETARSRLALFFLEQAENRVDVLPCAEPSPLDAHMLFFAADPGLVNASPLHAILLTRFHSASNVLS